MKRIIISALQTVLLLLPLTAAARLVMYVPTGETNSIAIIDLSNDRIVGHIDEMENAHGLSASPVGDYLVAGSMQAREAGKSSASKPSAMSEAEHRGHHADTPGEDSPSFVSIVHVKHGHVMRRVAVRALTHHTAVSPDGKYAVAVHSGVGGISIIDLVEMKVTKTLQTGLRPNYAVFSSNGKRLFVSNAGPGTVSEIDTANWSVVRDIPVGKEPEHLALAADGSTLYTANVGDGTVSAVDLFNNKVTRTFMVGKEPHGIALSDDGRWLFVSSLGDGTLSRIDLLGGGGSKTVALQPAPYHVAYAGGMHKLYVSSRRAPKIWVIDPETLKTRDEIDIGRGVAHQMVIRRE
jgi:YVTN family beta-propeller protein